ncbi:MAG: serine hydrolase [Phycisphaeraceae bacterium]|nr:serine hydrolase [Phycisphaeraceae bacterium]
MSHKIFLPRLGLLLCLITGGCIGQGRTMNTPDQPWPLSTPEQEGIDPEPIAEMIRMIRDQRYSNIHSFLMARHGRLVCEEYFPGQDGRNGLVTFDRDRPHQLRSVTKSITSALVGLAIDQGFIASVDTPIHTFFPEHAPLFADAKRRITIEHLLTMTAGLAWDQSGAHQSEPGSANDEARMENSPDFVEYVLSRPMADEPGTRFNYNSGCAILLAAILKKATGVHADQFAQEHLFGPLGVRDAGWWRTKTDLPQTHAGLLLRPYDAAKLGQLYLDHGRWANQQRISPGWIEQSTQPHHGNARYGYLWWLDTLRAPRGAVKLYAAEGNGGQFIFVVPDLDLVVVFTGGNYGSPAANQAYPMLIKHILPAIR